MARALLANGTLHTIDPFGMDRVPPILNSWPEDLLACVDFVTDDSMMFFANLASKGWNAGLIFVDGNHDYEFALFDIISAARFLCPGGFLVIDNISQPGPFSALMDFLSLNPGWEDIGKPGGEKYQAGLPFDAGRTGIPTTDFAVLRAPSKLAVGERPYTPGERNYSGRRFVGASIEILEPATGKLLCQAVQRSFTNEEQTETTYAREVDLDKSTGVLEIDFDTAFGGVEEARRAVEIWLVWKGKTPLTLSATPISLR